MISYAQNGEDVVLARAFTPDHQGFYIDIGASDPVVHSVTNHFYERGWHGINVEPASVALRALRAQRWRDVNLGVGVGSVCGEVTFYELPPQMTGCSTFSAELAEAYHQDGWEPVSRTIEVTTLAALCRQYASGETIDFLKIDVEGHEADVLAGADFDRFRPRILVIEATVPGTSTPAYERWEPGILNAGYRFALFDGLNRFYVRDEDERLTEKIAIPANVLDNYVPHQYVVWREQAETHAAVADQADRLVDDARRALAHTREDLRKSQAALRDARTELEVTRATLIGRIGRAAGRAE
jgi:FkbM family methyltransferase